MCERKHFALIIDFDTILMMLEFATEVNLMISMSKEINVLTSMCKR